MFIFMGGILINLLIKKISCRYFAGDPFVLIKILKEMIKFIILKYILIMLKHEIYWHISEYREQRDIPGILQM